MRIVLTGGGTGGHLFPLVTVAEKIKEKKFDTEFLFIGPDGKMENEIMAKYKIPIKNIQVGKMRRYFSFINFVDFFKVIIGIFQSLWILLKYMPDAIFSKGGYASFPVVFVGWLYQIPILIHDSDATPGLANFILGKFADRVAVSYPEAEREFPADQVVLTGNPIRADITSGDAQRAREFFHLSPERKIIFVWGGSQGAKIINEKIVNLLPDLLKKYQIIHQTGENNFEEAKKRAGELGVKAGHEGYYPVAFIGDELKDILAVSDLVISRAGANSISEIAANSKPAIIIPIEKSANNHQRMNAYSVARTGGCIVLEENNLGENLLLNRINQVMDDNSLQAKLSENIKKFYHPDAAERLADGILGIIE